MKVLRVKSTVACKERYKKMKVTQRRGEQGTNTWSTEKETVWSIEGKHGGEGDEGQGEKVAILFSAV